MVLELELVSGVVRFESQIKFALRWKPSSMWPTRSDAFGALVGDLMLQMRKLQAQRPRGGRGSGDCLGVSGTGAGDPEMKEAKRVEMAAWLAAEIEVSSGRTATLDDAGEISRLHSSV